MRSPRTVRASRPILGWLGRLVASSVVVAAVTLLVGGLRHYVSELSLLVLYLLVVLLVAAVWGAGLAVTVAVLGVAVFEYLFIPPRHTLQIDEPRDILTLVVFLATAVVVGQLAARLRRA